MMDEYYQIPISNFDTCVKIPRGVNILIITEY